MQELELTWSQVIRIWWAAFWRWIVLANITIAIPVGIVGIALWAVGLGEVRWPLWTADAILLTTIPAGFMALRLALKAPYRGFRVAIVAPPDDSQV
jgi:hypothetical protein